VVRPTKLRLSNRQQLDQRTTFDNTTPNLKAPARPINAVRQESIIGSEGAPSRSYQIAQALNIADRRMPSVIRSFQERQKAEKEQGAFLAQQDKEKPKDGPYLIEGYESMEGELHARQYATEAQQYYAENFNKLDPQEFNEGLKALSEQYIEAAPSDAYLKNFIPRASEVESKLISKYNTDMAEEFQEQSLALTSEIIADEIDIKIQETLGISLEGITGRTEDYIETAISIGDSEIGEVLRTVLTETQAKGKKLNLDKQAISNLFVHQVGALAIETGMPELLDFASIEDSDKIRLETNPELMKDIKAYRQKAESNRDTILQSLDNKEQKRIEYEEREIRQEFTVAMGNVPFMNTDEKLKAINKAEEMLLNNSAFDDLSGSQFRTYHDKLMDMKKGLNSFADESQPSTFVPLYYKARKGNLQHTGLVKAASQLTESNFKLLAGMISDYNQKRREDIIAANENALEDRAERREEKERKEEEILANKKDKANDHFDDLMPRIVAQIQDSKGISAMFEGDTNEALEARLIIDYENLTEEYGRPLTVKEINELIFDPYVYKETEYDTANEFISGEGLSKTADSNPVQDITEGAETVAEAEEEAGIIQIFDSAEDYLPEGLSIYSYSPERQEKGIEIISTKIEDEGLTYTELSKELQESKVLSGPEGQDYLRAYYYMKTLNQTPEGAITGRYINKVQEELRAQEVPEELIKTIIQDL